MPDPFAERFRYVKIGHWNRALSNQHILKGARGRTPTLILYRKHTALGNKRRHSARKPVHPRCHRGLLVKNQPAHDQRQCNRDVQHGLDQGHAAPPPGRLRHLEGPCHFITFARKTPCDRHRDEPEQPVLRGPAAANDI
jgi:hypothetical protein